MQKILLLSSFLLCAGFSASAQSKKAQKKWRVVVIGKQFRVKAILQKVTDSSIVLLNRKNQTNGINFTAIRKIKLRKLRVNGEASLAGFLFGGIAGGTIIGTLLSKGKEGEPAAMAGVVGGIGGGLIVGITGALTAPLIVNIFTSKKFYVKQDSIYYQSLKLRLKPYCLIQ